MHDFQGYFSRTLSFNFQDQSDFPGLFRSWNFQEKNQDFPGGMGTLITIQSSGATDAYSTLYITLSVKQMLQTR